MQTRNTVQRQIVLQTVLHMHDHPTADNVYAAVAAEHPSISKATVYRNLASLSDDGRLRHIKMPSGADRFDHQTFGHNHIECILCGRLEDAPLEDQTALNAQAAAATGYRCVEHEIVFRGICPACAGKQH